MCLIRTQQEQEISDEALYCFQTNHLKGKGLVKRLLSNQEKKSAEDTHKNCTQLTDICEIYQLFQKSLHRKKGKLD